MPRIGKQLCVQGIGAVTVAAALLASCALVQAEQLAGSEWRPTQIGDLAIPAKADIFVRFEAGGKLRGNGGCNGFSGSYRISGDDLEMGPLAATNMACPETVMDRETAFMLALQSAKRFKRNRIDLQLTDDTGAVVMALAQRDAD